MGVYDGGVQIAETPTRFCEKQHVTKSLNDDNLIEKNRNRKIYFSNDQKNTNTALWTSASLGICIHTAPKVSI